MVEKPILQIPFLMLFSSHIFTHELKGVHEVIMVYRVSFRNKFIKQNSVNNEAAFMLNKLFSHYVGMEMMMDSSIEMTAAAFLGCTHKPRSCQHLLSSWKEILVLFPAALECPGMFQQNSPSAAHSACGA
jgi:hypothetical protein